MKECISREAALAVLKTYNKEPFHILHGLTVEGVMRWYPFPASARQDRRRKTANAVLFSCRRHLLRFGGHDAVQLGILREVVNEGQDRVAVEQQPLALTGVGHIGELMRRNVELLCENLPVASGLIEHIDEIAVFKDVLNLAAG